MKFSVPLLFVCTGDSTGRVWCTSKPWPCASSLWLHWFIVLIHLSLGPAPFSPFRPAQMTNMLLRIYPPSFHSVLIFLPWSSPTHFLFCFQPLPLVNYANTGIGLKQSDCRILWWCCAISLPFSFLPFLPSIANFPQPLLYFPQALTELVLPFCISSCKWDRGVIYCIYPYLHSEWGEKCIEKLPINFLTRPVKTSFTALISLCVC